MEKESQFIPCECSTHAIKVSRWDDESDILICYYAYAGTHYSLIKRLKLVWLVLIKGQANIAEIALSHESQKQLKKLL